MALIVEVVSVEYLLISTGPVKSCNVLNGYSYQFSLVPRLSVKLGMGEAEYKTSYYQPDSEMDIMDKKNDLVF